ncbi:MAG: TonB-dependent receptor [Saprospirales bacterium]|nr:TonB-dependent receptor [Saprospirales bacterium]
MNKVSILLPAFCLLLSFSGMAQTKTGLSGKVIDPSQRQPVSFAAVSLFLQGDSILLDGMVTDEEGKFAFESMEYGVYTIKVEFLGFDPLEMTNIELDKDVPFLELGALQLQTGVALLSEATVVAERELQQFGLDKKVFNVQKNLGLAGANALEAMENIPSVTVDIDGNISLRGSANVRVLIDGKPSGLVGFDRRAILTQIPASTIDRIEVMTTPSAKYDPEGTAGIINIITKPGGRKGINLQGQLNAGTRNKYNGSVPLSYRTDLFQLSTQYSGDYRERYSRNIQDRTNFFADTTYSLYRKGNGKEIDDNQTVRLGLEFYLPGQQTLTANGTFRWQGEKEVEDFYFEFSDDKALLTNYSYRDALGVERGNTGELELGYRKLFDTEDQNLTLSLRYSGGGQTRRDTLSEDYYDLTDLFLAESGQLSASDQQNQFLQLQGDYVQPIGEDHRLEAGFRGSWQEMGNDFQVQNFDPLSNVYLPNSTLTNDFLYDEKIAAAYGIVGGKWALGDYEVGLRAEQTYTTSNLLSTGDVFENDYFSLFPSGSISWKKNDHQAFQLSLSRRINRPQSRALNPFSEYTDTLNIRMGNPFLLPEYIYATELNYQFSSEKFTFQPALYFRYTQDVIQRYRYVQENGVQISTWTNLNNAYTTGIEFVATYRPVSWWNVNGNFNVYRTELDGSNIDADLTNAGYLFSGSLFSTWTIGKNWTIQSNGFYRSRGVTVQGNYSPMYSMDVAIRRSVLRGKGSLTLRVSDIFDTRRFEFEATDPTFESYNYWKRESRIAFLNFTYSLRQEKRDRDGGREGGDQGGGMMDF